MQPGNVESSLIIRVNESKTKVRWVVPELEHVSSALNAVMLHRAKELNCDWRNMPPNEPIFCKRDGTVIHSFKKSFNSFLEEYDLLRDIDGNKRTSYSLRHTYGHRMIEKGLSIYQIAVNMGTSVKMIEDFYSHTTHKNLGTDFL